MLMRNIIKNLFLILLIAVPLSIIFLAFFRPVYGSLVRKSILVFTVLSVPYCLLVKDPRKGLLLFLLEVSLLEGAWKNFTYGMNLKLLVYVIRNLLLYASFLNFLVNKKRILSKEILRQKPPYTGLIFIFLFNIFLQFFNPGGYNFLNSIAGSRLFWEMIPLYWMGFYLIRDKNTFKILCWAGILCVFFNSTAGMLQYNWGKARVASISEGYHNLLYKGGRGVGVKLRPPGLGPDMGTAGHYFTNIIVMTITLFILRQSGKPAVKTLRFLCLIILTLVNIAGLIASASRSPMVFSVIVLIFFFILRRDIIPRKLTKILTLSVLLLFLVLPYLLGIFKEAAKRYETIKTLPILLRTITVTESSRFAQAFIIPFQYARAFFWGNGLGKVGPGAGLFSGGRIAMTNAENTLNLSITEIGTIGTILWLVFHIIVIKYSLRIYRSVKTLEWKLYGAIPMSYMLLLLFHWPFGQLICFPQNAGFWFMSGILTNLRYLNEQVAEGES